jgi:hypothetical protein
VAQIERHQPSLLDLDPAGAAITIELPAVAPFSRVRFARLRRLRRAA